MTKILLIFFLLIFSFGFTEEVKQNEVAFFGSYKKEAKPKKKLVTISMVIESGNFIELSDNSLWQVADDDTNTAEDWILPSDILLKEAKDKKYPYTLTNTATGQTIKVKKSSKEEVDIFKAAQEAKEREELIRETQKIPKRK